MESTTRWQCARCGHGKGQIHELKAWPEYFNEVLHGRKMFELRLNDRGFECGDELHLREWDPETETYTGRECWRHVNYILLKHAGLAKGYVLMGLQP